MKFGSSLVANTKACLLGRRLRHAMELKVLVKEVGRGRRRGRGGGGDWEGADNAH